MFHDECIECWRKISKLCPVCKQETQCTKLYLDLEAESDALLDEISSLKDTISEYKKLAVAQSKAIAAKSHEIWESEIKHKEIQETNARLKDNIKQIKMENTFKSLVIQIDYNLMRQKNICLYPVFECTCYPPDSLYGYHYTTKM